MAVKPILPGGFVQSSSSGGGGGGVTSLTSPDGTIVLSGATGAVTEVVNPNLVLQSAAAPIIKTDVIADAGNTNDLAHYSGAQWHLNGGVDVTAVVNTVATDPTVSSNGTGNVLFNSGTGGSLSTDTVSALVVRTDSITNKNNGSELAHFDGVKWDVDAGVDMSAVVNTAATEPLFTSDGSANLTLGDTTHGRLKIGDGLDADPNWALEIHPQTTKGFFFFRDVNGNGMEALSADQTGAAGPSIQAAAVGTNDIDMFWQTYGGKFVVGQNLGDGSSAKMQVIGGASVDALAVNSGVVPDGTYTMGLGVTTNGTITIVKGMITAIQEAS